MIVEHPGVKNKRAVITLRPEKAREGEGEQLPESGWRELCDRDALGGHVTLSQGTSNLWKEPEE